MNSTNYPDLYRLLGQVSMANGGMVPHMSVGGTIADWYRDMYGPLLGVTETNAVDPFAAPVFGPSGQLGAFDPGGVGAPGAGTPSGPGSGPTQGVNSSQTGIGAMAADAIGVIASVMGMPGLGLVGSMPAIANMLGLQSAVNVPGVATVDVSSNNVGADTASIANQVAAAVNAGIATSNMGQTVDAMGNPTGSVTGNTNTGVTGPGATAGSAEGAPSSSPNNADTDDGNWARGGLVHAQGKPRHKVVRRGALANVR